MGKTTFTLDHGQNTFTLDGNFIQGACCNCWIISSLQMMGSRTLAVGVWIQAITALRFTIVRKHVIGLWHHCLLIKCKKGFSISISTCCQAKATTKQKPFNRPLIESYNIDRRSVGLRHQCSCLNDVCEQQVGKTTPTRSKPSCCHATYPSFAT